MIILKTKEDIAAMRAGGKILSEVLALVATHVAPGMSSLDLDTLAERELRARGATPAFKGYQGYPATLCVSVNNEVVHGIPTAGKLLAEGDVVGLDLGGVYDGRYTDMAMTVGVGKISSKAKKLLSVTREALDRGVAQARPGNTVGDIGEAVQRFVERKGFGIVRSLVGHGVGTEVHEDPQVPNYGERRTGTKLTAGMTIAIEPMVTAGDYPVRILEDGWTVVTVDGGLSAHFEVTVAITDSGVEILTPQPA